jgi:hypothetical protein
MQVYKQLENSPVVEEMNIMVERDIKEPRIDNSIETKVDILFPNKIDGDDSEAESEESKEIFNGDGLDGQNKEYA